MDKYTKIKNINIEKVDDDKLIVQPIKLPNYNLSEGLPPQVPQHPALMYSVASCGKGKTNLMVWMLHTCYKQFFNNIYIFSGTIHQDIWKTMKLDMTRCFEKYSDALFLAVKEDIKNHPDEKTLIIIDDMSGGTAYSKKNSPLSEFMCNHRHFPNSGSGTSIWIVSHAYKSVPKLIRSVISDLIVFETSSADELEVIINDNRGTLSYNDFLRLLYQPATCEEYHFLYIKRKEPFNSRFRKDFDTILNLETE
jgi:hypothetical protein